MVQKGRGVFGENRGCLCAGHLKGILRALGLWAIENIVALRGFAGADPNPVSYWTGRVVVVVGGRGSWR